MSTITICDVCSEKIEDPTDTASLILPTSWWVAMGIEPTVDAIDVCSPECLIDVGDKAGIEDTATEEEPEEEEEEPVVAPKPAPRKQARLRPPSPEEINDALGVTQRG